MLNGFGNEKEISALRSSLENEFKVRVSYHGADMSMPDQIADLIAETKSTFGKVDILVNNAGIQFTSPLDTFPIDKWDKIIAINLTSNFHTIKHALPIMREQKFGRIINISSVHGKVASINKSAYVAAKHGVVGLTKVTALETARDVNLTCNAVCPG
jgi:3-hydroxybutyrate dehydrogenase